jgi:hypothetical protein
LRQPGEVVGTGLPHVLATFRQLDSFPITKNDENLGGVNVGCVTWGRTNRHDEAGVLTYAQLRVIERLNL